MKRKPRHYSNQFKRDALLLLESSGKNKTQLETELGITHGLLGRWEKQFTVKQDSDELELSEIEQLKAENRRLKRENAILQEEREILKKTVSIFSKDPRQ